MKQKNNREKYDKKTKMELFEMLHIKNINNHQKREFFPIDKNNN